MVKLGSKVRDTITGFEGIAHGRTTWLNGCVHVGILPTKLNDKGEAPETAWFDEARVEVLKEDVFKPQPTPSPAGGPAPSMPRM